MNRILLPVAVIVLLSGIGIALFSQRPWEPRSDVVQPVPFSHRVHAGVNHIPCQYCHEYARRSQVAGVPPIMRCVGCHGNLVEAGRTLRAVRRPWMDGTQAPFEIRWNRVYTLPDFVRFSHMPHVRAGLACQACHGAVETMDRIKPVFAINMGFCINCHTQRNVRKDCFVCHY